MGLPTRAYTPPPLSAQVQRRRPVCAGLVDVFRCFPDGGFRSVVHGITAHNAFLSPALTPVGFVGATRNGSPAGENFAALYVPGQYRGTVTVHALCAKTGSGTGDTHLFRVGGTGTEDWGVSIGATHTKARAASTNVTLVNVAQTDAFTTIALNDVFCVTGVLDQTDLKVYWNGLLDGDFQATVADVQAPDFGAKMWIGTLGDDNEPDLKVAMAAVWWRALTVPEVQSLAADPYQVFRDPVDDILPSHYITDTSGDVKLTIASAASLVLGEEAA